MDDLQITELAVKIAIALKAQHDPKNIDLIKSEIADYESSRVELPVKPACENCKYRHTEEATNGEDLHLCNNPKIRLWNLTNCDIDITEFGCTYFESKSV